MATLTVEERIQLAWLGCNRADVLIIHPLGSRQDTLLYNRRKREVSTGIKNSESAACFLGSIEDFERKMAHDYAALATAAGYARWVVEYRAALKFLRSLPPLEEN